MKYFLIQSIKNNEETINRANENKNFGIINIDLLNLEECIVKTEESFESKKVDITIKNEEEKFICLIENKINATEGEDQTRNYAKLCKRKYQNFKYIFLFLTPFDDEAESEEFININYFDIKNLLIQVLEAKKSIITNEVIFLIKQFIQNLEVNILNEGEIQKLCEEIYKRHNKAIDKIVSFKPDFITKIKDYLVGFLDDEWELYPTRKMCLAFKKKWLEEFKELYRPYYPFIHYEIRSWEDDGLHISIEFHIEEDKNKGKQFNIREKLSKNFEKEFRENKPKLFSYQNKKKVVKFKEVLFENGYETESDLKYVAEQMNKLIRETINSIEEAIKLFKKDYKEDIPKWIKQISS